MPVLRRETLCYPDDLLKGDLRNENTGKWSVLHTRPRAEKSIARQLRSLGVPFFLPQFERRYRRQRRLIRSWLPLFPGYMFVCGDEEQRSRVSTCVQIANILGVDDQETLDKNLKSIHHLVESGFEVAPEERLEPGAMAEVVAGPLKGVTGTIVRRGSGMRLILEVDFIHRGASVEVETSDIRWVP